MDTQPSAQNLTDAQSDEARRLITDAYRTDQPPAPTTAQAPLRMPTSFRDDTPLPAYGPTPPVAQPEARIIPAWAAGTAVASIGIGAGITGVGCGAWLVLHGLAAVTLTSVLMVTLPLAALAALATAIGSAVHHARTAAAPHTHHYNAPVTQHSTHTEQTVRGLFGRITNG